MTNDRVNEEPIDAVILWVDGNDEKHKEKILPYLKDKVCYDDITYYKTNS